MRVIEPMRGRHKKLAGGAGLPFTEDAPRDKIAEDRGSMG
jgi:hypothetical protein